MCFFTYFERFAIRSQLFAQLIQFFLKTIILVLVSTEKVEKVYDEKLYLYTIEKNRKSNSISVIHICTFL